ncbi:MAG TPA: peptidoglycan DD-metalloendopeptidase family protein [Roseiflexaceae bacterium]|nr:peptidoglycan DD-metalloendopeptidase family protein [Roseiflexaceae bacterium]
MEQARPQVRGRVVALLLALLALGGCGASASPAPARGAGPAAASAAPAPVARESSSSPPPSPRPPSPTPPATPAPSATLAPAAPAPAFSYPIGLPGRLLGDGFFIRHGAGTENTWYNPGHWHTGEDWYAQEGETAGAHVYAAAAGTVVYVGANYPGRVVIVRHADDLFSMYGHLDPAVAVARGQQVARGQLLGTVLRRDDGRAPSHLHFEIRTFLMAREVNGAAPRYRFRCGRNCPPGPGYWPIRAPDVPADLGWRTPVHVIAGRMFPPRAPAPPGAAAVASKPISHSVTLWSAPPEDARRTALGELQLRPGERFELLGVRAGPEDARGTSAMAYELWYRIRLPDGQDGWVQAAIPAPFETGGDGRPSSVYFNLIPFALPVAM